MFGSDKPKEIPENKANPQIERIYHEIKQTLRVSGITLNFRVLAAHEKFFSEMWDAMRLTAETRAFEDAADEIRSEAVHAACRLGRLDVPSRLRLGESQSHQIKAALDLYHYINPKLLVFTSAVKLTMDGYRIPGRLQQSESIELIERGVPTDGNGLRYT